MWDFFSLFFAEENPDNYSCGTDNLDDFTFKRSMLHYMELFSLFIAKETHGN